MSVALLSVALLAVISTFEINLNPFVLYFAQPDLITGLNPKKSTACLTIIALC